MAYHCINGFLLPPIYGLTIITTVEVIMLFWQVNKVAILTILSWFLICSGWSFSPPSPLLSKISHFKPLWDWKMSNQLWKNVGPSWLAFLGSHTNSTIFLLISKDHDIKLISFPFQHIWIWNSLLKFFGATSIFFICLSSLTLIYDIEQA